MNFARPNSAKGPRLRPAKSSILAPVSRPKHTSQATDLRRYMSRKLPSGRTRGGYRPTCRLLRPHFEDVDRFKAHRFQVRLSSTHSIRNAPAPSFVAPVRASSAGALRIESWTLWHAH